ncbi:MAG TPA: efflux RND transporter periplasmic adaptor subunit [Nitrospiria bacterium]|nr:efflux RND transporter periplasmic adaptor subunit [Nitrospiria bacterium]
MSELEHPEPAPPKRGRLPLVLLAVMLIAGAGYGVYQMTVGRYHVGTDDAYVNGDLVRLTPRVSGTVVAINADETQFVRQGQLLVQLDPRDAEVARAEAEANLGQTVRDVAQLFANARRDAATVSAEETRLSQAGQDLARDQSLVAAHGVSEEELQHDENAVSSARAALGQAQAALAATRAAIAGTTPETHPRVKQAEAVLRSAWLDAARTRVVAPVSGYIVRRTVQLGQQVTPGTEMLALVSVESMWINANFKETQLGGLRIGQPAAVSVDMYGSRADYHGRVLGLTAGTGSSLAVLPAQNASGNWIKIVQRLTVRIGLDPKELAQHPLFLGLSTKVDVDIRDSSGAALSQKPAWHTALNTDVYAAQDAGVDAEIRKIVAENLNRPDSARPAAGTRGRNPS